MSRADLAGCDAEFSSSSWGKFLRLLPMCLRVFKTPRVSVEVCQIPFLFGQHGHGGVVFQLLTCGWHRGVFRCRTSLATLVAVPGYAYTWLDSAWGRSVGNFRICIHEGCRSVGFLLKIFSSSSFGVRGNASFIKRSLRCSCFLLWWMVFYWNRAFFNAVSLCILLNFLF